MHSQLNYSTRVKRNKKKENEKQINKVTSCKQKVHQLFFKIYFKKRKLQIYIYTVGSCSSLKNYRTWVRGSCADGDSYATPFRPITGGMRLAGVMNEAR